MALAIHFLIDDGRKEGELVERPRLATLQIAASPCLTPCAISRCQSQHQIAGHVERKILGPFECKVDHAGIGPGADNEVVFELALIAIEDQIDAGVERSIACAGVVGNVSLPLRAVITEQIVGRPRQRFEAQNLR